MYATTGNYTVNVTHLDASATDCTTGKVSTETHIFNSNPFNNYWHGPPDAWYESAANSRENQTSWNTATGSVVKTVYSTWRVDSSGNQQNAAECQSVTTWGGSPSQRPATP